MNKTKRGGGTQRRYTPHCQVCLSTWVRNHVNKLQACNAYGTRSPVVDEDRGRLAWQRLLKPFAVVVACNWVAFIATNEVLSYCSLCQLWIQANFGCSCCRFSSFSLRPSIDVAPDGHVGRWTSSPLLHAVEAPGTFLWHFFRYLWYLCKCWPNY